MRTRLALILAFIALPALAASPVTVQGPNGTQAGVSANGLKVDCISGCSAGSNSSVGSTGSAVPASATYVGVGVAGNLTGLTATANGLKVDGSGVTQPVSGTVTANAGSGTFTVSGTVTANAGTGNFNSAANGAVGAAVPTNAVAFGVNVGGNSREVTASNPTGSTFAISTDDAAINGVVTSVGNGTTDAGTQRVTLSSNSTGQVTLAAGAATIGALTANQSVNQTQINGSAVTTSATGVAKVGITGNGAATLDAAVGAATAPTNGLMVLGQYNTTVPAPTAAQSIARQADSTGGEYVNGEGRKASYAASANFAALTGDIWCITGSGTKTVRITRIEISSTASAGGSTLATLNVHSSADSGGTPATQTDVPLDSTDAGGTAVVKSYTAAPTPGSNVGAIRSSALTVAGTSTNIITASPVVWTFGTQPGERELVLRGTAQQACINTTAITAYVSTDWTEE